MSTTAPHHYRLTRPDGLGFFRRRSGGQFVISAAGGGLMLIAVAVGVLPNTPRIALGVLGALVVCLGAGRSPTGENLVDLVVPVTRFLRQKVRREDRWEMAVLPWQGLQLPPIFSGVSLLEVDPTALGRPGGRFGVVFDKADGSVSVVFRVHGDGFVLADPAEQDRRVAAFGAALAAVSRDEGAVVRVAWSQTCAPAPVDDHFAYLSATARSDPHREFALSYLDLVAETAAGAMRTEVLITLTIGLDRVRTGPSHGGDRLVAAVDRAIDEAALLAAELSRAGLVPIGPLPAGSIARAVRERLDPAAARTLDRRDYSLAGALGLVALENAFPAATDERAGAIRTDGTWHRLFRVAEWPRTAVRADWLCSFLCEGQVTRSFTVVFTPQSRRVARRQALAVATRVGATIDERERKGQRVGAEERRAHAAAEALDEELEQGAAMELVIGLVDVTAESPDALRVASDHVLAAAADAGMELRAIGLRQAEALVAALPLGRLVEGRAK